MFDIAGTVELGTICPGTGTWNRLQDGIVEMRAYNYTAMRRMHRKHGRSVLLSGQHLLSKAATAQISDTPHLPSRAS